MNTNMNSAKMLNRLANYLNVPVEDFFNSSVDSAKLGVKARVLKLLDIYITADDELLSDRDLLTFIADRILEDK